MALALMMYTFMQQYTESWLHSASKKTDNPLRLGVLSTAQINPAAIIRPVETHPDIVLYAIASRDASAAASYAKKYNFQKSYGDYAELLADSDVDFVYISIPNGLHFEWAMRALTAGKHVLLEKPFTSNAIEAEKLTAVSRKTGKILMEGFHWQFHPAAHRFREILDSRTYGRILKTDAVMTATPTIPPGDIRWHYELSGGSLMDMTYALSFTRYALHAAAPDEVMHAKATSAVHDARIDQAMRATLRFADPQTGDSVFSTVYTNMARPWMYGVIPRVWELPAIRVETEKVVIYFYNAMMPHIYHYIQVTEKEGGKETRYEKVYEGGPKWGPGRRGKKWWSTYRYQLEAFVDAVRGRQPVCWVNSEESINQMKTIDAVYKASGLPLRPTSILAV